jgi:putative SbcD/Mre11-related phosphoesterase
MESYKLMNDIYLVDKALWLEKQKILAIADLHIGYEGYLAEEQGILLPRRLFQIIKKDLSFFINFLQPKKILINGDLKHEFGKISEQEWQETLAILDLMLEKAKVILIKGNHDTILEPIARKKGLEIVDYYCYGGICFMHGHKIFDKLLKKAKILVFAHTHPAIILREGIKAERYKCWLFGRWKGKKVIVMPSFIPYAEGIDVLSQHFDQPFLKNLNNFEVLAIGDKIYKMGKVKDLK